MPTTEEQPRTPFGEYGMQKAAIEAYLLDEARRNGFPATVLHPGHIVGPGLGAARTRPATSTPRLLAAGRGQRNCALPNLGMETVHHVHADDVAQAFVQAIAQLERRGGRELPRRVAAALTLRGYAETMAAWFGQPAVLAFCRWEEWRTTVSAEEATGDVGPHRAQPQLQHRQGAAPARTTSRATRRSKAVQEAVTWLIEQGIVQYRSGAGPLAKP